MSIIDWLAEHLGLVEELPDEAVVEQKAPLVKVEKKERTSGFKPRSTIDDKEKPAAAVTVLRTPINREPAVGSKSTMPRPQRNVTSGREERPAFTFGSGKSGETTRTITMPGSDKAMQVVVLEPVAFDDSQKVADYLRENLPVVINFEDTDNVVAKRMTDFLAGALYAINGTMKKIGSNILVCAPRNVNIDLGLPTTTEEEKPKQKQKQEGRPWEK